MFSSPRGIAKLPGINVMIFKLHLLSDDQMPPKMTSTFNNEYYYPRDTMLTDATINCKAKNGQIK